MKLQVDRKTNVPTTVYHEYRKVRCYKPALWNHAIQEVPWFSAVPHNLFIFAGVCELLGGVGLTVPAMTGVKPKLTPFPAFGLMLVMMLAAVFHICRADCTSLTD
jgi:hypothetical protein